MNGKNELYIKSWLFGIIIICVIFYYFPYYVWERLAFSTLIEKIHPIDGKYDLGFFFPVMLFNTALLLGFNIFQTLMSSKHLFLGAFWAMGLSVFTMLLVYTQINMSIYDNVEKKDKERFISNHIDELHFKIDMLEKEIMIIKNNENI